MYKFSDFTDPNGPFSEMLQCALDEDASAIVLEDGDPQMFLQKLHPDMISKMRVSRGHVFESVSNDYYLGIHEIPLAPKGEGLHDCALLSLRSILRVSL